MSHGKNILDDSDFIDNLIIGKYIWSGKPDLFKTPSYKKLFATVSYLLVFIILSSFAFYFVANLINVEPTIHLYFLVWSFVYIVFVMRVIWQGYHFIQAYRSNYVITETHVAQLTNKGKMLYQQPLTHIYQIIIQKNGEEIGSVLMKIKKSPSKKRKIIISNKMNYPNLSFEGIKDYESVAELLLEKRNNAMNTLDWEQLSNQ